MFIPKYYFEEDRQKLFAFHKQNNFAALVTFDGEKPIATHAPVEIVESENGSIVLFVFYVLSTFVLWNSLVS